MNKVTSQYNKDKDIWCLLNKGPSSNNSSKPTKVYELLVQQCGEGPSETGTSIFIDQYLKENNVDVEEYIKRYQDDWDSIQDEYKVIAEKIFGVSLPQDVTAYLTVNNRSPYNIKQNFFYVPVPSQSVRKTVMHELWHFYTWYGLGEDKEEEMGKQKYNDLKESLTVLLNVECKDLFPEGEFDGGYPQHQELREYILELWEKEKDITKLWHTLSEDVPRLLGYQS